MEVDFELFEEGARGRTRDRVHVTLGKDYHIYFSGKALEALGRPDGVALLFDRRRKIIGVMPSALNREHAFQLRKKRNMGAGRVISAKNFCEHYEIVPAETVAFPQAEVNRDGVMVLDLNVVKTVGRRQLRVESGE